MSTFVGTIQEFHHFIGPRLRNAINGLTRNHRLLKNGVCEGVHEKSDVKRELHSAHLHGRERRVIIEQELLKYTDERGIISCDLEQIEEKILKAHMPIDQTFKFLCHACHTQYDSEGRPHKNAPRTKATAPLDDGEFPNLGRIELWAKRPLQINHRMIRAFLILERNGEVEYSAFKRHCVEKLNVNRFDGNYASMKTDAGNSHGKIFFDDGTKVRMWDRVRKEVDKFFGKT